MKGLMKRGNTWYIRYQHEGKDKWEAIGPSKRQAELVLAKRKIEIFTGKPPSLTHTSESFRQACMTSPGDN